MQRQSPVVKNLFFTVLGAVASTAVIACEIDARDRKSHFETFSGRIIVSMEDIEQGKKEKDLRKILRLAKDDSRGNDTAYITRFIHPSPLYLLTSGRMGRADRIESYSIKTMKDAHQLSNVEAEDFWDAMKVYKFTNI